MLVRPDIMDAPLREPLDTAGLSTAQAAEQLARFGPNEAGNGKRSPLAQLLPLLGNPLALVLLVASGLSALLGDKIDAALIASMVAFSVVINLMQTWRSQKAAEKLRLQVAPTASVLRDGTWQELPRRQVVPGDVVRLGAGDLVPADAHLLEARDLHVQEAALTGESLPADKTADAPEGDAQGTVWLGTSVVNGTATARVLATGGATQFGDVVARLAARSPETEFERGLRHFGLLITRTVLVLVLVILAASLAMHRPAFESLLFAVALAVGLTPEFLPMITTVTLAQGAARMARQHVIVKRLSAIQDLGSIDILCSDKTGTLTLGEMRVEGSLDPDGQPSDRPLVLARLNSRFETGIRSPLDVAILAGAPPGDDDGMDEARRVAVRLRTASPFDRREARDGQPAGDQGSARLRLRDLRGRRGRARALAGARSRTPALTAFVCWPWRQGPPESRRSGRPATSATSSSRVSLRSPILRCPRPRRPSNRSGETASRSRFSVATTRRWPPMCAARSAWTAVAWFWARKSSG